jgi:transcriptional regulator with XRE-family HTH domain
MRTHTAAERLGDELLRLRLERGLSLRKMAKELGMTAHSGLVDYERGYRIPPNGLLAAYARALRVDDDRLTVLHRAAMAERARRRAGGSDRSPADGVGKPGGPIAAMENLADAMEDMAQLLREIVAGWPVVPAPAPYSAHRN